MLLVLGACAIASPAWALVSGGGPKKTDCFAEWLVSTRAQTGKNQVNCVDGDANCDIDGVQNGSCTVGVSICGFQTDPDLTACTPATVTAFDKISVKVAPKKAASTISVTAPTPPAVPVDAANCGDATVFTLPLLKNKKNQDVPSAKVKFKMRATAGKKDSDSLTVRCLPGTPACTGNPQGGPSELLLTTASRGGGGDLDNGWNGVSHNFPIVGDSVLDFCLSGCDGSGDTSCTGSGKTGPNTRNGKTFGAPLPLLAAGTQVCVINKYDPAGPDLQTGTADDNTITVDADSGTGTVAAHVHLLADVYITSGAGQVCPRCSGSNLGDFGTCIGGRTPGAACRVDGTGFVNDSVGNYNLSTSCLPPGTPVGTLKIALDPFTTGSTSGGKCQGQGAFDDGCTVGTCSATCTGPACVSHVTDVTNPTGPTVCQDAKGGISQLCCSNISTLPCYPTRNGGQITRTGRGVAPTPDAAGASFPATGTAVLTSVFCEPATGNPTLDVNTAGLPGPGALIQPMSAQWLK